MVVDEHVRALGGEEARARGADPARGAGHDDALACETGVHDGVGYRAVKVFIVSDLEGVSGVTKPRADDAAARRCTRRAAASTPRRSTPPCAARRRPARPRSSPWTATAPGDEWTFNSLIPELLDEACDFVVQDEWTEYTAFLESGVDAALFVGMHAMAGTRRGVMNHTVSGQVWQNLWFNGVLVGETGHQRGALRHLGMPGADRHAATTLPATRRATCSGTSLVTVAVKQGLGAQSARNVAPLRARALIEDGARRGARRPRAPSSRTCPGSPCEIQVEYKNTRAPDALRHRQGVERVSDRMIVSRADTWWDAWRQFFF